MGCYLLVYQNRHKEPKCSSHAVCHRLYLCRSAQKNRIDVLFKLATFSHSTPQKVTLPYVTPSLWRHTSPSAAGEWMGLHPGAHWLQQTVPAQRPFSPLPLHVWRLLITHCKEAREPHSLSPPTICRGQEATVQKSENIKRFHKPFHLSLSQWIGLTKCGTLEKGV